jgi:hypothetical protein
MGTEIISDKWNVQDILDVRWSADDILKYYPCLGIPHFQRGLVWGHDSVALLMESLYLDTPCGALILWQPREPSREGIALPETHQVRYLIIDGQQRIRTVHMALSGTGEQGGDVEDGDEDEGDDRVWCLNLARVPELWAKDEEIRKHFKDQERYSLFRYIQPPDSPKARFKHNVIPLRLFFEDRDSEINALVSAGAQTEYLVRRIAETDLKKKVKQLRMKELFSVYVLKEDGTTNGLADVVSLYNRINSGGKRVESEEAAFASLVALAPETGDWLRAVFAEIHPPTNRASVKIANRDEVLRRRKERNFGFKLIIRTFIQVCAYHFSYSLGSNTLSFDVVDSPRFRGDLARAADQVEFLRTRTREILSFVRGMLRKTLWCDDLQMLPDTMALLPAFQLLIRFPGLMKTDSGKDVVGFLIQRLLLQRRFNQRDALDLVDFVNKSQTADECISKLEEALGREINISHLRKGLKESNALQDRYTLLLYWLLRKNGAIDFSYSQLPQDRRAVMLREYGADYEREVLISEERNPEKQHIIPYKGLESLYEIKARGRISRHMVNNIGNITYISRALNHFETGLGSDRARLEDEPRKNLEHHFLVDSLESDLVRDFLTAAEKGRNKKRRRTAFERFCKVRRDLIARGFVAWGKEVQACARVDGRIEPEQRLHPQDEDRVRAMAFPDAIEDALLGCVMKGGVRFDEKKSAKRDACVFNVRDQDRRIVFEMWLCNDPPRIEIVPSKNPLFDQIRQWMADAGYSPFVSTGRWVLSAESDRDSRVAEVFQKLTEGFGQRAGDVSVCVSQTEPKDKGTVLSEQDFLDSVKEPRGKEIFGKLISFAKEIGYVHYATKSVSARMPYGEGGHLRFFRLFNYGTVKVIPLDGQLKKHGVDDQIAWDTVKQLEAIFHQVGLKSGKPELSRYLNTSEIGEHLDQFMAVFKQAAEKIKAISPTRGGLEGDVDQNYQNSH